MPRLTNGLEQVLTNLGIVGSGYKLFFYETGTTTLKTTYSDEALTIANTNPIVLNSAGRPSVDIWGSDPSLYRMILGTPDSIVGNITTITDVDPIDNYQINNIAGLTPIPTAYWGATAGLSTAYTLEEPLVNISNYSNEQTFFIDFHIACGNNPTLKIKDLPALNLKKYNADLTITNLVANDILVGRYIGFNNGSDIIILNTEIPLRTPAKTEIKGYSLLSKQVTISNNVDDPDHDLDFTAGNFTFDDGSGQATVSAQTKKADEAWAVGTGVGGMAKSAGVLIPLPTDGIVHMFAISNANGSVSGFGFDTSIDASNLLTTDTVIASIGASGKYKRLASFRTDGSANIYNGRYEFFGSGYKFIFAYGNGILTQNFNNSTASPQIFGAAGVPNADLLLQAYADPVSSGTRFGLISSLLTSVDITPNSNNFNMMVELANENRTIVPLTVKGNENAQFRFTWSSSANDLILIWTLGWIEYLN
jgi:hypothetical protein